MEHLTSDESIIHSLRLIIDSLTKQWRDKTLLLRTFPQLARSFQEMASSLPLTPLPSNVTNQLQNFLLQNLEWKKQQLPINKNRVDRLYSTTPSTLEIDEACSRLFLATLRCYQSIIPTLPSAKKTLDVIFYFNDLILSSPSSSSSSTQPRSHRSSPSCQETPSLLPKTVTSSPPPSESPSRLLLLLFSLQAILTEFILSIKTEMKACGVTIFSLSNPSQLHSAHLSAYLTSIFSFFSTVSSPHLFLQNNSSFTLSPYILLSSQQLCQYISLFVRTSLTPSTEGLMIQNLIVSVLQEVFLIERMISYLFTLVSREKSQQTHSSILSLLSPDANPSSLTSYLPSAPSSLLMSSVSGVSSLVISQKNQILRDFIFHQLCNQTTNGPDRHSDAITLAANLMGTDTQGGLLSTGRIYLCKVQMMWNLQVIVSPCPSPLSSPH
jgi:hypothetical protein